MRRPLVSSILLAAVAACGPIAPTKAPVKPVASAAATASPVASPPSSIAPGATPTPTPPTPSTPVVAAAALSGFLRIPAKIISDNGGGVISNNGASIISDNGGGVVSNNGAAYHVTAAPTQLPVQQARVSLVDAAGKEVATAVTDAQGRYSFPSVPADHNYLLTATLGKAGTLQAIVPPGSKTVDTDLVSTLTTAYILDQYVKGQVQVLDKLPAKIEANTRASAAAALGNEAALTALPDSLQPAKVVAAVNELRRTNKAFDEQMEAVRVLLLVAGQADGGAGRPALDVAFKDIRQLGYGPDGTLYVLTPYDRRLYRIGTDGVLRVAAGTGSESTASLDGKALTGAGLGYLDQVILEPAGGMALLDHIGAVARLSHAGPDGVLHEVARHDAGGVNAPRWDGIASLPDGGWAILANDEQVHGELWSVVPPAAPVRKAQLPNTRTSWSNAITRVPGSNRLVYDTATESIFY
ncbi:MAG: Serine/threonine protein kinase [Cyanobacteria bacterium RYN_339]|nr:Serine/threonine protein kinase [Cyanobacteria bacterium RYN_339]